MGMYTELVFKAAIRADTPDQAHNVLLHLFSGGALPTSLPDHPFFRCPRWNMIGRGSSFYHTPFALSRYGNQMGAIGKGGHVFSRSDLKNYDGEIREFLDWVDPYIDAVTGACVGWTWYEEEWHPTLVFKK